MAKLIHLFSTYHTLGGVESILAHHHRLDREYGIDSLVVSAFVKGGRGQTEPVTLGLNGVSTLHDLRQRFSKLIACHRPETIIYHNLWGCHTLCELDGAHRRIGFIHTDSAIMRQIFVREARALDGIISVSSPITELAATLVSQPEHIRQIAYPVSAPIDLPIHKDWHQPFRLGYCGRLVIEQKRVDRLPYVVRQLREIFPEGTLEILGDGPARANLEAKFKSSAGVIFHGRRSGDEYWRTMAGWDAIVFTSDFEGTPISLLEAMQAGLLPIYPVTGSGGDDYVLRLSPSLLYQHGNDGSLSAVFKWLKSLSKPEISSLRRKARELVAAHSLDHYFHQFNTHLKTFASLPQLGQAHAPQFSRLIARTPFFAWKRCPWTRSYRGLLP